MAVALGVMHRLATDPVQLVPQSETKAVVLWKPRHDFEVHKKRTMHVFPFGGWLLQDGPVVLNMRAVCMMGYEYTQ